MILVITGFALVAFPVVGVTCYKVYLAFNIRNSGKNADAQAVARYRKGMATNDDLEIIRHFLYKSMGSTIGGSE